jgi:hypothetical protein
MSHKPRRVWTTLSLARVHAGGRQLIIKVIRTQWSPDGQKWWDGYRWIGRLDVRVRIYSTRSTDSSPDLLCID